ncbi:alpha/beta fold hydrolase [Quadrisphaera sp. DSM 44207]|uniref:alpha/beta fold hydrolase n=1 Tax=Quadrisphaera sp. DSM 44207 TaxID=1881057 RepID=UPI00087EC654|nr:alpha/beta hydrolase [Quadrisphaera sp. DSM 44207]SDQ42619.1 Pimeloyl-ACP methyl ester carboxylesterase [Quadrisphaera sp. DSM 44207]
MEHWERDGLVLDVRESGPDDGEVVVCLHGFPQDGEAFGAVAPRLAREGLRVLVPDQRGYSPGARPPGRRPYRLHEAVADVLALLDAAGAASAHVVGHDWGGFVAWALAAQHPQRVRSVTVLSTPHPRAVTSVLPRSTQVLRSSYMAFLQLPRLPEALLLGGGGRRLRRLLVRGGLPQHLAERYAQRMLEPGALTAALGWYRALPLGTGLRVGPVRVPTTFLWGRRDPSFAPAAVRGTRALVQGPASGQGLDVGHWLPELAPEEVAAAVLAGVRAAGGRPS